MEHIFTACERYLELEYHLGVSCDLPAALRDDLKTMEGQFYL